MTMAKQIECASDVETLEGWRESFRNHEVDSLVWREVGVEVRDKATGNNKRILDDVSGACLPGELVALMGASGSGKTTLLNSLAHRTPSGSFVSSHGEVLLNGAKQSLETFRRVTSFVEQEDALIGSLTVEETLRFVGRLALVDTSRTELEARISELINSFGLSSSRNTIVGTPIRKGLSGGQKRRLSVISQLITAPKVLFLDEPTSGLDSTSSFEVISYLKKICTRYKILVIASIHSPSTKTFELFDKVALLSQGTTCYFGRTKELPEFFRSVGFPVPALMNPAEHALDVTNTDYSTSISDAACTDEHLAKIRNGWASSEYASATEQSIQRARQQSGVRNIDEERKKARYGKFLNATWVLIHRGFVKSVRDVVAYWIRLIMYTALAVMMGTVWLRLDTSQDSIQPFINAIFFGSAFMSFMAIAYVPAFLEDRAAFVKERANGLCGPVSFLVANFVVGVPYLFLITLVSSVIAYWLSNFQPTAQAFFTWVMWVFLDLLAAESLVVLVSSLLPNFVVSLAVIAFANGLWMCVGGFLVPITILNVFWRYVFHYIDYQAYVFQGMMVNEFQNRVYDCAEGCFCMYQSDLAAQCQIDGRAVLQQYDYPIGRTGKWVGILLGITAVYRLFAWVVIYLRKS